MNLQHDKTNNAPHDLHHRVPALAERLAPLRRVLAVWARRIGLSAEDCEALVLASYEAMANVVEHAYPDQDGVLDLRANLAAPGRATVTVTDYGRWKPPASPWLRGRGLPLIQRLAPDTRVSSTADGTTVTMSWPVPPVAAITAAP